MLNKNSDQNMPAVKNDETISAVSSAGEQSAQVLEKQHIRGFSAQSSQDSDKSENTIVVSEKSFLTLKLEDRKVLASKFWDKFNQSLEVSSIAFIGGCVGLHVLKNDFKHGEQIEYCTKNKIDPRMFLKLCKVGEVFKDGNYVHVGTFTTSEIVRICEFESHIRNVFFSEKIRMSCRNLEKLQRQQEKRFGKLTESKDILKKIESFKKDLTTTPEEIKSIGEVYWKDASKTPGTKSTGAAATSSKSSGNSSPNAGSNDAPKEDADKTDFIASFTNDASKICNVLPQLLDALNKNEIDSEKCTSILRACQILDSNLKKVIEAAALCIKGKHK